MKRQALNTLAGCLLLAPCLLWAGCDTGPPLQESAEPEAASAPEPPKPYRTQMVLKGNEVHLTGSAPDEIDRDAVRASLKARMGRRGKIRNDLSFRTGAPAGWSPTLQVVGGQLVHFKTAKVVLVDQDLSVSGEAISAEARDEAMQTIERTIPSEMNVTFEVAVAEEATSP